MIQYSPTLKAVYCGVCILSPQSLLGNEGKYRKVAHKQNESQFYPERVSVPVTYAGLFYSHPLFTNVRHNEIL